MSVTSFFRISDIKQVFDFIRCSNDKEKLLNLVKNDAYYKEMDEDAFDVVTRYTNSKELVMTKDYTIQGGKNDVCKAIQDLMADSREKTKIEIAKELLDVLNDDVIAEKTGLSLYKVKEIRVEAEK